MPALKVSVPAVDCLNVARDLSATPPNVMVAINDSPNAPANSGDALKQSGDWRAGLSGPRERFSLASDKPGDTAQTFGNATRNFFRALESFGDAWKIFGNPRETLAGGPQTFGNRPEKAVIRLNKAPNSLIHNGLQLFNFARLLTPSQRLIIINTSARGSGDVALQPTPYLSTPVPSLCRRGASHVFTAVSREAEDRPMGKTINAVLEDLDTLIQVWTNNPTFAMGDITLPILKSKADALRVKSKAVDEARTELSRLIDEANDASEEGDGIMTRGRSGIRAFFGPDSPQYAQVGGTRASERKARKGKKGGGQKP